MFRYIFVIITGVFPARAGMIPFRFLPSAVSACIPRESGDDPYDNFIYADTDSVFPARAGMIRMALTTSSLEVGIPRESGDDPIDEVVIARLAPYSPRERG